MRKIATVALAGFVIFSAGDLAAQVCNGTAPFSAGNLRAGFGVRMPDNVSIIDGELALSSASGLYGGATIAIADPDGPGGSSTSIGGFLGKPMMVDQAKTVEMCPQGFVRLGESSSYSVGGGVSFGRNFTQTSFDLVPFGAALLSLDGDDVDSEFNLLLNVGAGFVLGKKWTIRPSLYIPLTDGQSAFGVMGYLNFGGR